MQYPAVAWLIFVLAAALEVGGDAFVRRGLRGHTLLLVAIGFMMLGSYGLVVNLVRWDFSKLLGVYVAVFAAISVLVARFILREPVPASTWLGIAMIIAGGVVIQFGSGQHA